MATIIQIKRSSGSAAPTTGDLAEGELAYSQDQSGSGASAKLYIESLASDGTTAVIHTIGGKYYTDAVDAATNNNTASTIVKRDASGNFSAGTITADIIGNVTGNLTGDITGDITGDVTGNLTGNVTGNVTGDLTGNVTGNVTGDLTGDVTGDVTGDLTGNVTGNVTGDVTGDLTGDVTGNVTGNVTGDLTGNADTATALQTSRDFSASGDASASAVSFDGTGNVDLALTLATVNSDVGSYGSTTAVPVITVNAKGLITAVTTEAISTSFDIAADSGTTDTVAGGETLTFTGGTGVATTVSANEITFDIGQAVGTTDNVTFADVTATGDLSVTGSATVSTNLTVTGNLTVNGTTTTLATTNSVVSDTLIELGNGVTGAPGNDSGIVIERGDAANAFMGWDESADKFIMGTGSFTGASTGNLTITTATLIANIEGNVTGNLTGDVTGSLSGGTVSGLSAAIAVADGGTGAGTFTSNGIIYGNGTGALQATAAGTDGYILYSNSGTPAWTNTLDGGSY